MKEELGYIRSWRRIRKNLEQEGSSGRPSGGYGRVVGASNVNVSMNDFMGCLLVGTEGDMDGDTISGWDCWEVGKWREWANSTSGVGWKIPTP